MANLVSSRTHLMPGKLEVSELFFRVPKDYSDPSLGTIDVFARSVTTHERPIASGDTSFNVSPKPWFVWLQGGPGKGCHPPQKFSVTKPVLERGYQILYMDQRGTGLSSAATAETLALQGDVHQQAEYLKLFRADNIVRDCEAIREILTQNYPPHLRKWTIYGQSFGGYCAMTYLSKYPEGLSEAFISAGIQPIKSSVDDVYRATYAQMKKRNKVYYEKYPEDVESVHTLAIYLESTGGIQMPAGGTLTFQRFLMLGMTFGISGGIDTVHDIVLRMGSDLAQFKFITRPTLANIEAIGGYDDSVIYAILREAIYCDATSSNWAAERVGKSIQEFSWVSSTLSDLTADNKSNVPPAPLYFSGGMVFPHMFDTFAELKKLKELGEIIAQCQDWPELYDARQLSQNEVPLYTALYVDDAFVDFELSRQVLKDVKNCKQFITNTMYHDGVQSSTSELLGGLWALRDDAMD